jgi:hypothetical protein
MRTVPHPESEPPWRPLLARGEFQDRSEVLSGRKIVARNRQSLILNKKDT